MFVCYEIQLNEVALWKLDLLYMGAFINHVDMAGGGGFAKCPYYYISLISKIVPKGGGGGAKCAKICQHDL